MKQDKNEDGTRAAITAVIVGGGPAGMIAALALVHTGLYLEDGRETNAQTHTYLHIRKWNSEHRRHTGLRVIVCEEQPAFTVDEPAAGQAHGVSPLPAAHPVPGQRRASARMHVCSGSEMSGETCSWPGRAGAVEREASSHAKHITCDCASAGAGQGQASL
jgi:hypothetical protein